MFGLEMLDVAIGVIFVYLLLSLICMAFNEIVEAIVRQRAKNLFKGIKTLLSDKEGTGIVKEIYEHPLVFGLFTDEYDPNNPRNLPTYIPGRNFALAVIGVIQNYQVAGDSLQQAINRIPDNEVNSKVKDTLTALLKNTGDDINKLQTRIEEWYDRSMDIFSGWYKERVQWFTLVIGLLAAIIVNADTIVIVDKLITDPAKRAAIVAAAQESAPTLDPNANKETPADQKLKDRLNDLNNLGLPIGWKSSSLYTINASQNNDFNNFLSWLLKVIGWIITGLAISLGAPFWFDMLNKIMVVRSTVKPREKSLPEASEDRQAPTAGA